MEEVIKKINGNLIEIKSNQNKDTFHISGGTGNISQQNIDNSLNTTIESITNEYINNKTTKINLSYENNELINSYEVLFNLVNVKDISNIYFEITDFDNNLSCKDIKKYCSNLKYILYYEIKNTINLNQIWNELKVNKLIALYLFNINSLKELDVYITEYKQEELHNIVKKFLLNEKIKNNKMPNIYDIRLTIKFYEKNNNIDFYKFFGYKINKLPKLSEIINTYLSTYLFLLDEIKNWNLLMLEAFIISNKNHTYEINELYCWLKKNNIKSNLEEVPVDNIDGFFILAIDGYFEDEDNEKWFRLKQKYFNII